MMTIPGDSISDSSEKLFQRGGKESQHICDFGERGVHAIQHGFFVCLFWFVFSQKISASHEGHSSPLKDFSAFLDMKRYKNFIFSLFYFIFCFFGLQNHCRGCLQP